MRYLRMLTNSALAAALGAAYLTVLVLQLNPQVPLLSPSVWRWFERLLLFYGVNLTVFFYAFIVLRELVALRPLGPGWVSVRVLAWMMALTAAAASFLMWSNLHGFEIVLDADTARRMRLGTIATTASAVVLTFIAVLRYSFGRRGSGVSAALLAIAVTASLALPLAARGSGSPGPLGARQINPAVVGLERQSPGPRVVMILLDGASLDYLWARVTDGRFPNFGRILDAGAAVDLATLRPTQAEPVWTAVATGKYPPKNGVRSSGTYRVRSDGAPVDLLPDGCFAHGLVEFGFVRAESHTSADWRARPLWDIIGGYGLSVGIVRWPVTYPAQPVRGFLVTDRFHAVADSPIPSDLEQAAYPTDLLPVAREVFAVAEGHDAREILPTDVPVVDEPPGARPERWDRLYGEIADAALQRYDVALLAVRFQGLDTTGHAYLRYAEPRAFGDVTDAERAQYGQVLDRYYGFIDGQVGRAMASLHPDDLLLVVSGFGMQPVTPGKRLLARLLGSPDLSGTHEEAPDGFLLAYGTNVVKGKFPRASVVDIAPTALYYLGLPVGRDMDGFARADLLTRSFTASHPITFIPSYQR
jgi:hypothetical protein